MIVWTEASMKRNYSVNKEVKTRL